MPSTRPFISFLFGNINGDTNTSTSNSCSTSHTSHQPAYGRNVVPSRVTPVRGTSPSGINQPAITGSMNSASTNALSNTTSTMSSPYPIPQKPGSMEFLGPSYSERRNSASSLNGSGSDKWWIGGISSDGNERYYRLHPLQRKDSFDGISMDRLSI